MNMTRLKAAFKALVFAVAAAGMTVIGTSTPAQAATSYTFGAAEAKYFLLCAGPYGVYASRVSISVGECPSMPRATWHWGSESGTWGGHTMRRLVNNYTGDCLTTDTGDFANVYMEPCGSHSGQFWTSDNQKLQNQNGNWLYYGNPGDNWSWVNSGSSLTRGTAMRSWSVTQL
ncbi:hypothetical protein ACFW3D_14820 [Streptomyces sp. NPDC058864]